MPLNVLPNPHATLSLYLCEYMTDDFPDIDDVVVHNYKELLLILTADNLEDYRILAHVHSLSTARTNRHHQNPFY